MDKNKQNLKYLSYKGYTGDIEINLSEKYLFGKVLGLDKGLISYEGKTLEELEQDFRNGIDDYLSYCEENNITPKKPFNGLFSIRINPELHRLMAVAAFQKGITVNRFIKEAVEHELHGLEAI